MRIALIVGISGSIGKVLTDALIQNKKYKKVIILTRRDVRSIKNIHVRKVVVNFEQLDEIKSEFEGVDDVFCLLGKNLINHNGINDLDSFEYDYPVKIATLAVGAGVPNFYLLNEEGKVYGGGISALRQKLVNDIRNMPFSKFVEFRVSGVGKVRNIKTFGYRMLKMVDVFGKLLSLGKINRVLNVPVNMVVTKMIHAALDEVTGSRVISSSDY